MPPPGALKKSSWEKRAAGLFCDAAAEHVYIIFPCPIIFFVWQLLWGRGKHDPSRHLSPDRRTRMGRRKISTMLLNTLMCGETGRISRVGSFVDKNDVKFWLVSSFHAAEFYIWPIAWDTKISLTMRANLRDNGKILGIVAYGVWDAAAFLGICVLKLWEAALSCCGCVLIVDAYAFVPPPAAVHVSSSSSWSKKWMPFELFKIVKIR